MEGEGREKGMEEEGTGRGGERTRPHPFTPPNPYFWIRPWWPRKLEKNLGANLEMFS